MVILGGTGPVKRDIKKGPEDVIEDISGGVEIHEGEGCVVDEFSIVSVGFLRLESYTGIDHTSRSQYGNTGSFRFEVVVKIPVRLVDWCVGYT